MFNRYLLLPLFFFIIIGSSCSSKFSVSKRKYMKGYHFNVAKNKAVKVNGVSEIQTKEVRLHSLVAENRVKDENVFASVDKQPNQNIGKPINFCIKTKIKSPSQLKNLNLLVVDRSILNKNCSSSKIQNKLTSNFNKLSANKPFDFFGGGFGSFGTTLLYAFMGIIVSILFMFLIFGFFALALSGGGVIFPLWLKGLSIIIGLLILLAIIVVVVINGD